MTKNREIILSLFGKKINELNFLPIQIDEAISCSKKYLFERHPNSHTAILYGSTITNRTRELSDIDLLIIREDVIAPIREQKILDGRLIQATIVSNNVLLSNMYMSQSHSNPYYLDVVATGYPILGDERQIKLLKSISKSLYETGAIKLQKPALERLKTKIANRIIDILKSDCIYEKTIFSQDLLRAFFEFTIKLNQGWFGSDKYNIIELKNIMKDEFDKLMDLFSVASRNNEYYDFIQFLFVLEEI